MKRKIVRKELEQTAIIRHKQMARYEANTLTTSNNTFEISSVEPLNETNQTHDREEEMEVVDIIFLDIDGVLLPFGDSVAKHDDENEPHIEGCIFPNRTMHALTMLLQSMKCIAFDVSYLKSKSKSDSSVEQALGERIESDMLDAPSDCLHTSSNIKYKLIEGNPKFVLSSSWRARPTFIRDILSSFCAYADATPRNQAMKRTLSIHDIWEPHLLSFFDTTDPTYHAARHEEIYKWVKLNTNNATCYYTQGQSKESKKCKKHVSKQSSDHKKKFTVRSWIVLDDEDLINVQGARADASKHAVKTTSSEGLTEENIQLATKLIQNQIKEYYAH